uniref:Secreted protein n=1 Tax=Heterorhabditis bacteriophora TaxID=37862 RepID=A0A1I7W9H5_HETBA
MNFWLQCGCLKILVSFWLEQQKMMATKCGSRQRKPLLKRILKSKHDAIHVIYYRSQYRYFYTVHCKIIRLNEI